VAGSSGITPPVDIKPIIQRLCNSLEKVHRERNIDCRLLLDEHCKLRADTGDLFELFGNLLENAYKHARHNVRISGQFSDQGNCQLDIEDDGEGIPAAQVKRVLQRGERADQQHPGQGIGLAVVNEIVRQYGATMNIDRSSLGGAKFSLIWPLR